MPHARVLNRQTMMWLPAALLLTAALLAAAGLRMTESSYANPRTTVINATVGAEVTIGTGASECGDAVFGPTAITVGTATNLGTCTLSFGTNNNAAGANIVVESTRPTGGLEVFCQAALTSGCAAGTSSFTSVPIAGSATMADGQYGVRLNAALAAGTCAAGTGSVWITSGTYYGVRSADVAPGAGDPVCNRTSTGTSSLPLQFTAQGASTKVSGTYQTNARFTAAAN